MVLNALKKGWAVSLIALSVIILNAPFAAAEELKPVHQKMAYSVYAGGIHALDADLDIDLSEKNRFSIDVFAKTYGLLGRLAPWFGSFKTRGWFDRKTNSVRPEIHESESTWKDELEVKRYVYNKDGTFKEYTVKDDKNDGSPKKVDPELTDQTTDILSATLEMMAHVAAGQECQGASEIFDGRRRYKLIFNHQDKVDLKKSRYNVYEGSAIQCTVEVQPVAGSWHKKPRGWFAIQEQGRKKGTMPTIWLASVGEGEPAIPVKVRVKTQYGTFFLHLTGYESQGRQLALAE